jgi:hypothetical protein
VGAHLRTALVGACIAALTAAAPPAHAAFPGANGKIAFAAYRDATYEIYTMKADGSNQTRLTSNTAFDFDPAWSPDGTKIAFVTDRDGGRPYEIYTMNADGTNQTRLTNNTVSDENPAWSPDGTKIAFGSTASADGSYEIYTMNADGSNQTRLTNNVANDLSPAWSPNGTKIAFNTNRDGSYEIYTMNADGTNPTRLTNNTGDDVAPAWSPDGTKIAFNTTTSQNGDRPYEIYTMNADGSNQTRLTNNGAVDEDPAWSPDGTKIAFATHRDPDLGYEIYTMNADGSNQTPLGPVTGDNFVPDWQPIPYTGYPRPRGASPLLSPLVPAYKQCIPPGNSAHGAPLAFPSCNPPQQTSDFLTVGTPDSNGHPAGTVGSVRYTPVVGSSTSSADLKIAVNVTGVLDKTALTPYSGELEADVSARITDKNSTPSPGAATMVDIPFPVTVPCAGSLCAISTTANAVIPGAITAGQRAIWELGQVQVSDGGADGLVSTTDNTLFMDEGVFVP